MREGENEAKIDPKALIWFRVKGLRPSVFRGFGFSFGSLP